MTETDNVQFTPVDIPTGLEPRWERRFPGRFRYELNALQRGGITPVPDIEALKLGRLALSFDWPLDATTNLCLTAVYPDAFPEFRPQVFLRSGIDPWPVRHISPLEGNLCLLGRDSRQWTPSCTLHQLLFEQLEDALRGTGDEDEQGEPAGYWWNMLGPAGACCLVDSAWDLGGTTAGTLHLRYVLSGDQTDLTRGSKTKVPVIRAVVRKVLDQHDRVVHQWNNPLPFDLCKADKSWNIRWIKLEETMFPKAPLWKQLNDLKQNHEWLQDRGPRRINTKLSAELIAIAHPSEIGFSQTGVEWVFFCLSGDPKDFTNKTKNIEQKKTRLAATILPTYRAGTRDIGYRVTAVELLRKKRILVVGIGAVGAPAAIELARNGCGILHLIEHDVVEPGNTVRWPLGASTWAHPKSEALSGFLAREYPGTEVHQHSCFLGQIGLNTTDDSGDDKILDTGLPDVDLVLDGSASNGVTTLLADRCRRFGVPLISFFATTTLEGGAVVRYSGDGGCPNCLAWAWHRDEIESPIGLFSEEDLIQPPGCAERTFVGAGYDLQEISLQAVRLSIDTLSSSASSDSLVQTLSFVDQNNRRCPPQWRVDTLPKHPECTCRY